MKFSAKKLAKNGQGIWTVNIDGSEWGEAIKKGKNKVAANIEVPGFRKGKAPRSKIETLMSPAKYLNAAYQSILEKAWDFAKNQNSDIKPFTAPISKPIKVTEKECEVEFIFDLIPLFEISDYKGIKSEKLTKEEIKVTANEIDKAIEQYREKFVLEKDKKEKKIAEGDVTIFDFEGFIDGVAFNGGKGTDFKLTIGAGNMIPDFESAMIGKGLGKSSIDVVFPEDYTPELANKKAKFKLNIKEIKERILPEKNDELVKDLNIKNINTYKELEKFVKLEILNQKTNSSKNIFVNNVIDIIIENSKIELPKVAINKEVENLFKEFEARVSAQKITMKKYKEQTGLTDEDIKSELVDDAKRRISSQLITDKVRNTEKFEVVDEELTNKYDDLVKKFGVDLKTLKSFLTEDQIKDEIIREKIINFLYENNG